MRGAKVIAFGRQFLNDTIPLAQGSHDQATSYTIADGALRVTLENGGTTGLKDASTLLGYRGQPDAPEAIVFLHNGLALTTGYYAAKFSGLPERDRRAVWRALGPLALGHALGDALGAPFDRDAAGEEPEEDPSYSAIFGAYTAVLAQTFGSATLILSGIAASLATALEGNKMAKAGRGGPALAGTGRACSATAPSHREAGARRR